MMKEAEQYCEMNSHGLPVCLGRLSENCYEFSQYGKLTFRSILLVKIWVRNPEKIFPPIKQFYITLSGNCFWDLNMAYWKIL